MGVKLLAVGLTAVVTAAAPSAATVTFVKSRQLASGGFAERGGRPSPGLTAWAVLGLRAARATPPRDARGYLRASAEAVADATDLQLVLLALAATGTPPANLVARVRALERPSGALGPTLNSTIWGALALRQAGEPVSARTRTYILRAQTRTGGWSWAVGVAPDSNDTAAAIQALRALGVSGTPIRRGLRFLRTVRNSDGGFGLVRGRASDAQSTAWAIQAFLAARQPVPRGAFAYLARLRRRDGSYRYSTRQNVTPLWVTAQVLPALSRRPFPLTTPG